MLPELEQLQQLIASAPQALRHEILTTVPHMTEQLPVYSLALGNPEPKLPAVVLVGGVHGLERIGTQVVLAYLQTLLQRLPWDKCLQHTLEHCCIYFVPLLNPAGMANGWRANGNCVDLMRNAPVECEEGAAWLVGGQRFSRAIPWHRGRADKMETESQTLVNYISHELFQRPFRWCWIAIQALAAPIGSGFLTQKVRNSLLHIWLKCTGCDSCFCKLTRIRTIFLNRNHSIICVMATYGIIYTIRP